MPIVNVLRPLTNRDARSSRLRRSSKTLLELLNTSALSFHVSGKGLWPHVEGRDLKLKRSGNQISHITLLLADPSCCFFLS